MQEIQKGLRGENIVAATLQKYNNLNAQIIRNFPLRNDSDTGYYQIDIVLVCNRGIFSLEVKNWNCIVECDASQTFWKTKYPHREIMVKSPFLQNKIHCKFLCRLIAEPVYNLVVFSDETEIHNPFSCVISCLDIGQYLEDKPKVYDESTIEQIMARLKAYKAEHDEKLFLNFYTKNMIHRGKY